MLSFPDTAQTDMPDYVATVLREYMDAALEPMKITPGACDPANPIVISVVRDENDLLPDFLRHYRAGGVERFVFIDNGSADGSVEFLREQDDVDLYRCARPFDWMRKHGWISLAIAMYGRSRWYVYADGDEHIVFDGHENGRSFADLAVRMDRQGVRRIRGVLIDMYRDGPILGSRYERGERLSHAYPLFDGAGYREERYAQIVSRKGGPRQRVFGAANPEFRPELTKYPMFRLQGRDIFANPHHVWPYDGNFTSPCLLGILHFKFLPDVLERVQRAIAEKNYWGQSLEYRCYGAVLETDPELSLHHEGSVRLRDARTLIAAGLIEPVKQPAMVAA